MSFSLDQTHRFGPAITVGSYEFAPLTRLIELKSKWLPFRLRWATPTAVRVSHPDGSIENLEISDPTRRVQIGLLLGAFVSGLLLVVTRLNRRKRN